MSPRDPRPVAQIRAALASASGDSLKSLLRALEDDDRAGVRDAVTTATRREAARLAEQSRLEALYALEAQLRSQGYQVVAGVDEVGRGALAGPLTAAAVVLPPHPRIEGLNDSKRLSPQRRAEVALVVREVALCYHVAHISPAEIDELGVTAALRRVMGRALAGLILDPDHVVVDGLPVGVARQETAVIKGDSKVAAIAAASVVAKVTRDSMMVKLAPDFPEFAFDVNKGYGTLEHLEVISRIGPSIHHRRSFCPGGGAQTLF